MAPPSLKDLKALVDKYEEENRRLKNMIAQLEAELIRARNSTVFWNGLRIQELLAVAIGVFFLSWLTSIALEIKEPSQWQYTIFRTVMSLGAAGIAAIIPGM